MNSGKDMKMAHGNASDFSVGAGLASCCWLIVVLFTIMIASCCGVQDGKEIIRREAVIKKHAAYIADERGNPMFMWNNTPAEQADAPN